MSTVLATQVRKHAKGPTKAAGRYWKGKVPKGVEVGSESEEEEEEQPEHEGDVPVGGELDEEEDFLKNTRLEKSSKINVALKDVSISQEGKVVVAGRDESGRTIKGEYKIHPKHWVFNIYKRTMRRKPRRKVWRMKRKRKNQRQVVYSHTTVVLTLCTVQRRVRDRR